MSQILFLPSRPVFLEIFGFSIRWYGIMYFLAFLIALEILPRIQRLRNLHLTRDEWASAVAAAVLGVLIGGRLGYVFFYEPAYFAQNPLEVLQVWHGGMSSHGGFIGTAIALLLYCLSKKISIARFADLMPVPALIGFALGRIGNFINEELYGTVTTLPWGMQFAGVDGLRHPIQLYDSALSLIMAGVCFWHLTKRPEKPGRTLALFLMLYGVERFLLEFIRDQQYPLIDIWMMHLTRGQLLTIPLFFLGTFLWIGLGRKAQMQDA